MGGHWSSSRNAWTSALGVSRRWSTGTSHTCRHGSSSGTWSASTRAKWDSTHGSWRRAISRSSTPSPAHRTPRPPMSLRRPSAELNRTAGLAPPNAVRLPSLQQLLQPCRLQPPLRCTRRRRLRDPLRLRLLPRVLRHPAAPRQLANVRCRRHHVTTTSQPSMSCRRCRFGPPARRRFRFGVEAGAPASGSSQVPWPGLRASRRFSTLAGSTSLALAAVSAASPNVRTPGRRVRPQPTTSAVFPNGLLNPRTQLRPPAPQAPRARRRQRLPMNNRRAQPLRRRRIAVRRLQVRRPSTLPSPGPSPNPLPPMNQRRMNQRRQMRPTSTAGGS